MGRYHPYLFALAAETEGELERLGRATEHRGFKPNALTGFGAMISSDDEVAHCFAWTRR